MARPGRAERSAPGAGLARTDAVQWRPVAASGRTRLDVADASLRKCRPGGKLDQGKLQPRDGLRLRKRSRDSPADAAPLARESAMMRVIVAACTPNRHR